MEIKCEILQDIYPNYVDDLCSSESKELVEEHLKGCSKCRKTVQRMKLGINFFSVNEDVEDVISKKIVNRIVTKNSLIVGALVFLLFLIGGYRVLFYLNQSINFSPEGAITNEVDSRTFEVLELGKIDNNVYYFIYEDGITFGTGILTKHIGLFWKVQSSGSSQNIIGMPYNHTGAGSTIRGEYYHVTLAKSYIPDIKYLVIDTESHFFQPWEHLEYDELIEKNDGHVLKEFQGRYALSINTEGRLRGAFTDEGVFISLNGNYRLIRGEKAD